MSPLSLTFLPPVLDVASRSERMMGKLFLLGTWGHFPSDKSITTRAFFVNLVSVQKAKASRRRDGVPRRSSELRVQEAPPQGGLRLRVRHLLFFFFFFFIFRDEALLTRLPTILPLDHLRHPKLSTGAQRNGARGGGFREAPDVVSLGVLCFGIQGPQSRGGVLERRG